MYGQGRPYFPPPPPKPPLSPLAIVAIVGGLLVLGIGGMVLLAALVVAVARADEEAPSAPTPAADTSPTSVASTEEESPAVATEAPTPAPSSTTATTAGPTWFCTASASVRVCGFAGACNYQMVFGNGFGKDRFLANQQAKNACEASARAKGASAVCVVSCSLR